MLDLQRGQILWRCSLTECAMKVAKMTESAGYYFLGGDSRLFCRVETV